jgi:hypothetical protein
VLLSIQKKKLKKVSFFSEKASDSNSPDLGQEIIGLGRLW